MIVTIAVLHTATVMSVPHSVTAMIAVLHTATVMSVPHSVTVMIAALHTATVMNAPHPVAVRSVEVIGRHATDRLHRSPMATIAPAVDLDAREMRTMIRSCHGKMSKGRAEEASGRYRRAAS